VRERSIPLNRTIAIDDDTKFVAKRTRRGTFMSRLTHGQLREWILVSAACFAIGAVSINALFLQTGPHPAPIFSNNAAIFSTGSSAPMILPRPRPTSSRVELVTPAALTMPIRQRPELIVEIQRALAQRGFYEGPADGIYGAKTDIAVRDFEAAAALPPSAEPNEALLRAIARSTVRAPATSTGDPNAAQMPPAKRVTALQRALSDFGYGQIRATGAYDPQTRAAIEEFERSRKLPVTGQISDRVTRELAAMTGRPLE
jgi:Putative peptidoglycan binding domain